MHLRNRGNRSGLKSLERNNGLGGINSNARRGYHPTTQSNRKDTRLNYNSSSIPYLNKRGNLLDSQLGAMPMAARGPTQM